MDQPPSQLEFLTTDLRRSIALAATHDKTLFCFVTNGDEICKQWEEVIRRESFPKLTTDAITLQVVAGSQEAEYLNHVCPLQSPPAVVMIKRGQIIENLQSASASIDDLTKILKEYFSSEESDSDNPLNRNEQNPDLSAEDFIVLDAPTGQLRLPNNAYEAFRTRTQTWIDQSLTPNNIFELQLRLLRKITNLEDEVAELRTRKENKTKLSLSEKATGILLNTPAAALTSADAPSTAQSQTPQATRPASSVIPSPMADDSTAAQHPASASTESTQQESSSASATTTSQEAQRASYVETQRARESSARAERERIKEQIKADREERRRLDKLRKESELASLRESNSTAPKPASTDIRIQVRTFDGSVIKSSFARIATITKDVRPWIDEVYGSHQPYNLKLVLTPLPNRGIETGEEDQVLPDLGITGSATMIMVPVKTYVESYTGGSGGLLSTGVGMVTGAAGAVLGGLGSVFGWGGGATESQQQPAQAEDSAGVARVRTLSDQRAEEARRRPNHLYNGNQLNFERRKDSDTQKDE